MKVLILGAGGREHALAWAVSRSGRVTEVVCAPGNGGIAQVARCVAVDLKSLDDMVRLVEAEAPGLTIVGPELPLSLGIVDALQAKGLKVFGPSKAAARLESSKAFAKEFMKRHQIPTAKYMVCSHANELEKAVAFFHAPIGERSRYLRFARDGSGGGPRTLQRIAAGRCGVAGGAGRISGRRRDQFSLPE
jgi:phosphoribosylamine--glycine ligase